MSSGPRSALPHSASDSSERNKHDQAGNKGLGIRILDVPLFSCHNYKSQKWHKDQVDKPAKLPTSIESLKTKKSSRKTSTFALLTMPKLLTVWITTNCAKFFKRWEYQTTLSASREICMQVKKQQLELDMEQQTLPNWERSTSKLYIITLVI